MREFLLQTGLPMTWALAVIELAVGVAALRKRSMLAWLVSLMSFGLAVDAVIQAVGVWMGEGAALQGLSQVRYLLHGVLVPLMLPIAFYGYGMQRRVSKTVLWAITGALMIGGIAMGVLARTEPVLMAGVLRYAQTADTPAFAKLFDRVLSIGGVIPVIVVGIAHLVRHKSPWLMLGGVVMFAFSALAPATHNMDLNFLITMIGEMLMVICFLIEVFRKGKAA